MKTPLKTNSSKKVYTYSAADRDCLKRVMYFESEQSSRKGLMAVGTVVMNRLTSSAYPDTICEVVNQKRQFAPGVMTRKIHPTAIANLEEAADALLRGERNPDVKSAMFFHTDGLSFPYDNMHYVTVAGGNAFYEKRGREGKLQTPPPQSASEYILAYAPHMAPASNLMVASDVGTSSPQPTEPADTFMVADASQYVLPDEIPLPVHKPQLDGSMSARMASAPPEIWSTQNGR